MIYLEKVLDRKDAWTQEEEDFLIENYKKPGGTQRCAKVLGKSIPALRVKAFKLRMLLKDKEQGWTAIDKTHPTLKTMREASRKAWAGRTVDTSNI